MGKDYFSEFTDLISTLCPGLDTNFSDEISANI